MSEIFQRGIDRVWTVQHHQNSPIHIAGMVLDPNQMKESDPFLFLAEDFFKKGTFDFHPHRGIETVTYVIEGKLEHQDNKAGRGELEPGDVQWMTAGKGVIHIEDPAEGETVHSLQLWVNLPREHKMAEPRYQNLRAKDMPVREEDGVLIRIFSGSSGGIQSTTKNYVPVTMVEINLQPGATVTQDLPGDYNGFMYVLEGKGQFGKSKTEAEKGNVLLLGKGEPGQISEVTITARESLRVLLYAGKPLNEPIVARGPFVMNTEEEIRQAYRDYMDGKFAE
ncbi:pirin family protein [Bacillus sp. ISL-40]|uniref:pirin family protein n=1 Tax=unclassified Bacillus (in: firmicutes) TaxID=185979 RepID=UPI001BE52228|nr:MULTISPECIES: pirin family protein [unclassified Bacillus (in: firmicutes)]MBT2699485.1 pirin family protein [Bacillus sp. ISL-40]MBT2722016.1 pirin family protein [Bacillus sp. ISL-46]MBT2741636.1 pirin family protein [Bacillus sp. ISL-77]